MGGGQAAVGARVELGAGVALQLAAGVPAHGLQVEELPVLEHAINLFFGALEEVRAALGDLVGPGEEHDEHLEGGEAAGGVPHQVGVVLLVGVLAGAAILLVIIIFIFYVVAIPSFRFAPRDEGLGFGVVHVRVEGVESDGLLAVRDALVVEPQLEVGSRSLRKVKVLRTLLRLFNRLTVMPDHTRVVLLLKDLVAQLDQLCGIHLTASFRPLQQMVVAFEQVVLYPPLQQFQICLENQLDVLDHVIALLPLLDWASEQVNDCKRMEQAVFHEGLGESRVAVFVILVWAEDSGELVSGKPDPRFLVSHVAQRTQIDVLGGALPVVLSLLDGGGLVCEFVPNLQQLQNLLILNLTFIVLQNLLYGILELDGALFGEA